MQQEETKDFRTEKQNGTQEEADKQAGDAAAPEAEEPGNEEGETSAEQATAEEDPRAQELAALQNRLLRLQADFDNFRRRSLQEKEQLAAFVTVGVTAKFLKVLDNFERAEASADGAAGIDSLLTGIKQIRRQFEEALKGLGVEEIEALRRKFDPNLHEAVMRGQNPDLEDETIDLVFEKGYKLKDKIIRHSKVRVVSNE